MSLCFAYFFNPQGMLGNITAEVIGLCLAALVLELLLVARDEQKKSDEESRLVNAVGLLCVVRDGHVVWQLFLDGSVLHKIKDIMLFAHFKMNNGEQEASIVLKQGEYTMLQLALEPLLTNEELDSFFENCSRQPDKIILKWTDINNVDRRRSWSIEKIKDVQKTLNGKSDGWQRSL